MPSVSLTYPVIDELLGEKLHPNEANLAEETAKVVTDGVCGFAKPGSCPRDVHSKATGLLRAEFRVDDSIPENLAKGVFIPGKVYQAYIRFSNGSGDPNQQSDSHIDSRGMAIKLVGVPGEKLLETDKDAVTQDFNLVNHPAFFTNDPQTYLEINRKLFGSILDKASIPFDLGLKGTLLIAAINGSRISNPFQAHYYSASAFRLGNGADRQAVKWGVKPVSSDVDPMPSHHPHDFLTEAMKATLKKGPVTMKFLIQPRTSESQSVEDLMHIWEEKDAPFIEVATITIPQQDFDTPENKKLGETMSFNPWHCIPAHQPLGMANRLRKTVYERMSRVRNEMNGIVRKEPTA